MATKENKDNVTVEVTVDKKAARKAKIEAAKLKKEQELATARAARENETPKERQTRKLVEVLIEAAEQMDSIQISQVAELRKEGTAANKALLALKASFGQLKDFGIEL